MVTRPQQIAEKFLAKLSESADIDAEMIEELRSLLRPSTQSIQRNDEAIVR